MIASNTARAVLWSPLVLQTIIIAQMVSIGGKCSSAHKDHQSCHCITLAKTEPALGVGKMGPCPGPRALCGALHFRTPVWRGGYFSREAHLRLPLDTQNTKGIELQGALPPDPHQGLFPWTSTSPLQARTPHSPWHPNPAAALRRSLRPVLSKGIHFLSLLSPVLFIPSQYYTFLIRRIFIY